MRVEKRVIFGMFAVKTWHAIRYYLSKKKAQNPGMQSDVIH